MDRPPTGIEPPLQRGVLVPADFVLPPPQPGVRYVRVPVKYVIVIADDSLRHRVDRFFHWPMIVLALLMLPLLAWEFISSPQWGTWQWWASAIAFALIWTAFLIEFVIKIAIAESRFEYVKRNWLDVIILALPLLRPLRITYLARTSRVFTLRGVGMKFLRYVVTIVVGLEATDRLLERIGVKLTRGRKDPAKMTRHELMREVKTLRSLTDRWTQWFGLHQAHIDRHGTCIPFRDAPPAVAAANAGELLPAGDAHCANVGELLPAGDAHCGQIGTFDSAKAAQAAGASGDAHENAEVAGSPSLDTADRADTVNRPG